MGVYLPADLQQLHRVDVNFAHWVQLAGLRVEPGPESIHLYLRWRLIRQSYRPWRCFVHVLSGDQRISSLDHSVLGGRPGLERWEPGDEGFEKLDHWWERRPENLALQLGLYDSELNVRCPIVASTLPVAGDSTAALVDPAAPPGPSYALQFATPPLVPVGLVFQHELELAAYAMARCGELVWLRLKWILRGPPRRRLRFFGHAVAEPSAAAPTLSQFDQQIALASRGPATWIEQNLLARVASQEACWLRAGVCTEPELIRVPILRGPQPYDPAESCFYRPLSP
jgi:hypothetical protein